MGTYGKFFIDFMKPFFDGIITIFKYIGKGIYQMFNVLTYVDIIDKYSKDINGAGWIIVILSALCLLSLFILIGYFISRGIIKAIKYRRSLNKQEDLAEEIDDLNTDIMRLKQENEKLMAMADPELGEVEYDENGNIINKLKTGESRFFKLTKVDEEMKTYKAVPTNDKITLPELCENFRQFAASEAGLYYSIDIIRLFISSFASNRLIILQGISGTGKTSLAHAFGEYIKNPACIASVQPSWRDSTELFGYFNEFTKRFNETEVLKKLYEASYREDVGITVLDEMNISRVEYYFAEMLSILELPSKNEWMIPLVPNVWSDDPVKLIDGKFKLPVNMWYIGTINNDDSTFMITDKVYDRAMPIEINEKFERFKANKTEPISLSYKHFNELFEKAQKDFPISDEILKKITEMDKYVIEKFRLSFGNRILKQITEFVPVYVACGGNALVAVDYLIAHKILRKFDQLNLAYIRNELDGFIDFLDTTFGEDTMKECKDLLERLKKTI